MSDDILAHSDDEMVLLLNNNVRISCSLIRIMNDS